MTKDKELKQRVLDEIDDYLWVKTKSRRFVGMEKIIAKKAIDLTIQKLTEKHEADTLRASAEIKRLKNQINHICPQCDKNLKINGGNKIAYYYCQDCLKDETELYPKEKNQS